MQQFYVDASIFPSAGCFGFGPHGIQATLQNGCPIQGIDVASLGARIINKVNEILTGLMPDIE